MMDHERPVRCARDASGKQWRLQCDEVTKTCLYAENAELDSTGRASKPLERARPCELFSDPAQSRAALEARGFAFVEGRADAPHGWTRDDRGRVFQVNFDLTRRLYVGASYSPAKTVGKDASGKRTAIDFGLLSFETYGGAANPTRHRLRAVEGHVALGPFSSNLVLLHYDLSRRFLEPLLRVTTFVGRPQRYDLVLDLGLWTELGAVEVHPADLDGTTLWKFGAAQVTLDFWQSANLDSYARARTGIGFERTYSDDFGDRSAVTPQSALEWRWIVDPSGFHNLGLEVTHETPRYFIAKPDGERWSRRFKARIEYEAILLALNDQPVSLAVGVGAERRSDLVGVPNEWAFVADTGLRFSLWAPPRPR